MTIKFANKQETVKVNISYIYQPGQNLESIIIYCPYAVRTIVSNPLNNFTGKPLNEKGKN